MREDKKLTLKMALLFLVVFVFFGVIIVKEKFEIIFIPKVEKIFDTYLKDNYMSIYSSIKKNKVTYKNDVFTVKISSSKNKNHYFYLTYSNKKVKDTYEKDYIEGNSLLNHISSSLEKEILNKTNEKVEVSIDKKLNNFTETIQDKLINESNYSTLKIYSIKKEIIIPTLKEKDITKAILSFTNNLKENNITPKEINFYLTSEEDLTKTLVIYNIKEENEEIISQIVKDILSKNNSSLLKENNIKYKYI